MAKSKYYVVWVGVKPGIYTTWAECERQVKGFPKAKYKSFPSQSQAEAAFSGKATTGGGATTTTPWHNPSPRTRSAANAGSSTRSASSQKIETDVQIYCDGACDPNPGEAGTGLVIYKQGALSQLWYGLYNPNGTNNTAELLGLLHAMTFGQEYVSAGLSVSIHSDSKYSIDCITKWAKGWKAKVWKKRDGEIKNLPLIQEMYALYLQVKDSLSIQHVRAHVGLEGNELADRMAVKARVSRKTELVHWRDEIDVAEILRIQPG